MSASSSERDPVEYLAEEFAQRLRQGERPALSEYTGRFPQHADAIRELFPALVAMEQLKPQPGDLTGDFENLGAIDAPPRQLGEYRLLREVGRGGMGVVYEAEQISLGRRVALKVLPPQARLNATYLERFRREAKAAARLHHTNIVPVFGTGEADGVPFYAMQFIAGEGLDKVLLDLRKLQAKGPAEGIGGAASVLLSGLRPAEVTVADSQAGIGPVPAAPASSGLSMSGSGGEYHRGAARVALQVAEALAYAHRQGILHRDVKPSNLLLDVQGNVWVTDFGLAKAEGSDELTGTGDIVGTLRFMAPERFDGRSLPQSDLYALGVTLYEMLTLRPAFDDANKAKLIEKVLHQPPIPPRKLDATIPRDLETIVLKCLAKDPVERYATADDLADDLRRFLADRPIKARRASQAEKVWRWCRRNPMIATLSAALLLVLTGTAISGVVMSLRLNDALGQAREDRDRSIEAEREGKRKLLASYMAEADSKRMSRRAGQRFGALKSIRDALAVGAEIGLSESDKLQLRNIALAALCLPDIEPGPEWQHDEEAPETIDPVFRQLVRANRIHARSIPGIALMYDNSYSPDGRFVIVGAEGYHHQPGGAVRLWRIDGPRPVLIATLMHGPHENGVSYRPNGKEVAFGHRDGGVSIYELETGRLVRQLPKGPAGTFTVAYHPTLPRLAVGNGAQAAIWDVDTVQVLRRFAAPAHIFSLAWHPRGHRLAAGCDDKRIYLWDASTGQQATAPWSGHRSSGIRLAFSRAGDRLMSNDWNGVLRLWDTATGQPLVSVPGYSEFRFSSDDRTFGPRGGGGKVGVLRVAGGQEMRTLHRPRAAGTQAFIEFSLHPDGRLLAAVTDSGLGLFDLHTGEERAFVEGRFGKLTFDRSGAPGRTHQSPPELLHGG